MGGAKNMRKKQKLQGHTRWDGMEEKKARARQRCPLSLHRGLGSRAGHAGPMGLPASPASPRSLAEARFSVERWSGWSQPLGSAGRLLLGLKYCTRKLLEKDKTGRATGQQRSGAVGRGVPRSQNSRSVHSKSTADGTGWLDDAGLF